MPIILMEHAKIRCDCGALIEGTSLKHAKANILLHKRGKKHEELMEIKENSEEKSDG